MFDDEINQAHTELHEHGLAVTLMLVDIDHFKRICMPASDSFVEWMIPKDPADSP